jgi:UDP-glucose 4-epimerase
VKVLVTGPTGFIGRPLVEALAADHEVWAVGRTVADHPPSVKWVEWDMSAALPATLLPSRIDAVVHLAQSRNYRDFPESAVAIARVNVQATVELLDHARRAGARNFVFASSGGVYGGSNSPLGEDAIVKPPDFYLSTKAAAEALASAYRQYFNVVCLRLFFPYGPGQSHDRFITRMVLRVLAGEPIVLYGLQGIRVNPTHVSDVVRAIDASLHVSDSHVVNVAGPDVFTLRELTELIAERVGRRPNFDEQPIEPHRDLVADIRLMKRILTAPSERIADRIGEVCDEVMAAAL